MGFGSSYWLNGVRCLNHAWSSYSDYDASLLLSYPRTVSSSKHHSSITSEVTLDPPHYTGGSSYHLRGSLLADDSVEILLQEGLSIPQGDGGLWDVKVAFRLADYSAFRDGELVLRVAANGEEAFEEYCLFNREIKGAGLIHNQEGWAVYEARMSQMVVGEACTLSLLISHKTPIDIDLRLGMISITPSMMMSPDEIKLTWTPNYPKITECTSLSLLKSKDLINVKLSWELNIPDHPFIKTYRIFRNDKLIGVAKGTREYYDKSIDKTIILEACP